MLARNQLLTDGRGVSRRAFIKGVGAFVAGAALLEIEGWLRAKAWLPEVSGEALLRATFTRLLGEVFQIYPESAVMPALRLIDVRDLPSPVYKGVLAPTSLQREGCFSLLFTGPIGIAMQQDTYRFAHDRLGTFPLFIVPMAPSEDAQYYEAIFNRQQARDAPRKEDMA